MFAVVSDPDPQLTEVPDLRPGPQEVLIRVSAATVNPVDHMVASAPGREAFGLSGRLGLGWDVAGTVLEVGEKVDTFRPGDRVAGLDDDLTRGVRGQAEQALLPTAAVAPVPQGLSDIAAATVPLNALTADQALAAIAEETDRSGPEPLTLLVTGGAGAVGGYALDLARERGWAVDALARASDAEFVASTGARLVTEAELSAYNAVLDAATLGEQIFPALRDGGLLLQVNGAVPAEPPRGIRTRFLHVHHDGTRLAELLQRSLTPGFSPRIDRTFPLEEAVAAYAADAEPGRRGRTVLTVG